MLTDCEIIESTRRLIKNKQKAISRKSKFRSFEFDCLRDEWMRGCSARRLLAQCLSQLDPMPTHIEFISNSM